MSNESSEEPKLIIDEDWKTQVQREKELLKKKQAESKAAPDSAADEDQSTWKQAAEAQAESGSTNDNSADEEVDADGDQQPPPPATFEFLVSSMATQAVAAMGQLPDEDGKPLPVRLDFAKHYIDLLGVLESKTQGNLSEGEKRFLQNTLHQLRLLFVSVKK